MREIHGRSKWQNLMSLRQNLFFHFIDAFLHTRHEGRIISNTLPRYAHFHGLFIETILCSRAGNFRSAVFQISTIGNSQGQVGPLGYERPNYGWNLWPLNSLRMTRIFDTLSRIIIFHFFFDITAVEPFQERRKPLSLILSHPKTKSKTED